LQTTGRQPAAYRWAHAIVRHALAESLNPDRAARLHRRAAQTLERLTPDDPAAIGEHYWLSRSLPGGQRGAGYCLAAAQRAADHHASQDAMRLLEFALDLTPTADERRRTAILARLAVAQAEALDFEHAPATTLLVLDALEPRSGAELVVRVVEALRQGAPLSAYEPLVHRGLDRLGGARDALWARLATVLDPVEAVTVGRLSVGRWCGYPKEAVAALRSTGLDDDDARAIEPFLPRSEQETAAILERSNGWTSPRARMRALDLVGRDLSLRHGLPVAAVECYRQLLELGQRVGSLPAQAEAHGQLALCLALAGELAAGEAHLVRAGALVKELWPGHRLHLLGTLSSSAVVAYLAGEGEWADMAQGLDRWIRTPAAAGAPFATVFVALDALCQAFAGVRQVALGLLDELADLLERLHPQDHGVAGSLWFATAAAWELQDAAAADRLAKLVDGHMAAGGPRGPAPLTHAAGRLAVLLGDRQDAPALFAQARQAALSAGARGVAALVDFDDALVRGDAAAVAAAARSFEALGMAGWARKASRGDGVVSDPRPSGLTKREVEVLCLVAAGYTSGEIAQRLVVSLATVNRHVANIYTKIGVRNRAEATAFAISRGLVRA
jgi:DNA-binding CsgD family transcriptional regulator